VFKRCKIPDDGDVSPELWIKYRADDQGKYCVMIPVKRPPPPGPHASKISEDTKWSIREAFEDAVKSAESPADALSIAGCLNLVNHLLKDPEDKLSESEVARIFDEAESIKSGIPIDFYSFLEVFSAIQEAAGSSAAEPDESGLGRNEADAPSDPTTAPVVGNAAVAVQDDSGGATEVDQSEKNLSTTTPETEAVVGTAHSVASGSLDDVTAKLQDSNPETETSPVHTSLTASELALAKEIFAEATSAGSGSSVGVMGIDVFKKTMLKLVNEMNEAAVAAGDKKTPAPAEKDLVAAFKQADTEKSGTADELNFIRLVDKVKTGAIKGLGGGMLSSLFTSRRKSAHKDEAEVSSLPSPSVATKGRSNSASNDEGSGGGFLSSIFTSKKKAAMAPNLAQAEKLHEHNDSGVGGELKEAEQRIVKKAFDSVAEKTTDSGDTLMSKEAFQMHVNNQYMVSSVVEPKENEIEVAYSSMGNSTEGVSKEEFVRFAALVKIGKVAGFSYEILFHSAVSIEDDAISSFVALDNSGRIKVLQGLPASEHVAYISKLESLHDRANIIMGLPTEVSAALLVELRLHGDFGDLLAVMPGKAAKKAVQGVLESGGRTKTGLVALHKGIPKNIGSQLVSCNSARDVSKLLCSLPTAQAASLLLEFHSRGAAGPVFDGMVSVASAGAAALLAQVSLVERSNLVSSLAITNRAIVLGYVTDDDKDTILEGMRATDKDETLAAISHSEDDFIVSFSVTLQDESVDSFGSEKRSAFVAATSAALGVSTSQVVVESVRAGSAVVSVQVSGLQNEEVAKSVVSKASEPKLLVAQLNEAGLGECSVSEVTTSRSNTADPPNNDALPNTAQTVQDNDEISGGEDAGAAETSTSHNDGSVTGDEDDAEVLMPQAKSEVVEENSVVQIAPDGKSDSGGNEDFEVLDPHLLESRNLANRENTVVTEFPGDPEADQIVGSTDLAAELSKGEVQPSPAEIQEVSSEEDEADDLPKKKASARIEDDNGKEQPSPAKIEEISSEEDENEILPYKTTSAKNEDPVSDFSSSEARDDEIRPSHEVEEVDAKGQNTDLGSTASEKIGQLSKEFVDAQPTSPASKALELSEEEGEDDERGTAVEATSTAQHSAQKPFQGLEVSSEEEEDDEADSAYQKHKEIPLASKREEPPVDVGTEENFGGVDSDGSEANDGSIDFDESESDPRLNELSAQSQGRNETASVSGLNGPSVANIPSLAAPSPQVRESVHNEEDFCISPQKGPTSGVSESSTQDVLPMSPAGLSVSAIQCNDAPSMDEPARGSALDMSSLAMDDDTLKSPIKRTVHEECEPIAEGVKDFDDESQVLQELETVDKPSAFAPGLAVESRFGGKTKYYGAKIVQQNSDGTYEVHYDDGDIEKAVHSDNICLFARAKQFPVGVRVEARFGGKNTWYPGEVAKDNGDGTYEVHYDDGDVDTAAKFLRALDAADDVHDSQESGEEEESVKGSNEVVAAQNENLMPDESGLELATELMEEVELELEITFPEWQLADFGASAREGLQADLEKCLPLRQGQDVRVVNLRAGSVVADLHISGFGTALEVDAFVAQAVSGKFVLDPTTYGNGVVWAPKEGALENPSTAVKEAVPTTDEGIVDEEEAAKFFTSREDEEEEEVVAENEIESTIEGQAKVAEDAADAQLQEENELAIAKEREETEEEGEREVALTSKTKGIESANAKPEDEIQPAAATEQEEVSISVIAMDAEALPTQTKEKGGEEVVAAVQTEAANEAHAAIEVEEHDDEQTIANKSDGDSPSKNKDNGAVADDGPVSPVAASATEPKEDGQINDDDAGAVSLKEQEDIVNVRSEGAEVASLKAETPPSAEGSGALKSGEETSLVPATMVQEHEQADAAVTTTSPSEVRAEDAPHALKSNDDAAEPPLEGGMESDDSMKKEAVAGLTVTSTTTSTVVTIAPAAALPTSPDTALPLSDTASPSTNTLNPAGDASIPPPSTTNLLEPSEVAATAALSPEVLSDASAAAAAAESRAVAAEQALQSERAASEQAAMAARAATDLAIAEAARQAILEAEARASADLDAERLQSKEKRDVLAEEVAALRAQAVETAEALTKAQSDAETASEELAEKVSALGEVRISDTGLVIIYNSCMLLTILLNDLLKEILLSSHGPKFSLISWPWLCFIHGCCVPLILRLFDFVQMEAQATSEQMAKEDLQQRLSAAEAELQVQLVRMQSAETELDDLRGKLDERHLLEVLMAQTLLKHNFYLTSTNARASKALALVYSPFLSITVYLKFSITNL
jgi:hypothetical protein